MADELPEIENRESIIDNPPGSAPDAQWVFIGTYTTRGSKGIYLYRLDMSSGQLSPVGEGPVTPNPSFLAVHPNHRYLYAVNETDNGSVSAFSIDPHTGALKLLNSHSSRGSAPCHITVDRHGRAALVANYTSGSVAVLPIHSDGTLGEATGFDQHHGTGTNPQRQEGPHGHCVELDPANRFALSCDLGLDKVFVYRFDPGKPSITPNNPSFAPVAPGAGPRHLAFHPSGRFVYVIEEMGNTITAFEYDSHHGALRNIQTVSTLPEGFSGSNTTAEIAVHPSGRFVYGSNRGHDSIAIFTVDPSTGKLTPSGHQSTLGKTPRGFAIDPTGRYLVAGNQDSDTLVVFRIDPDTGQLTPTGQTVQVPAPVCVQMMPAPK